MRLAVFGTGVVGKRLAAKLDENGHEVTVGTRNPDATLARIEPDAFGGPPFSEWLAAHAAIGLARPAAAAAQAEVVVNATNGGGSLAMLEAAGDDNLQGKVLVDVSNPLDASQGMPPSLFVANTDSLGEQIQRRFPRTRVVKTLNTMNCDVMVEPAIVPGGHQVFVCGEDAGGKAVVRELLHGFGWPDDRIIDLGGIASARGVEMYLPLWLRLWGAFGTGHLNIEVHTAES